MKNCQANSSDICLSYLLWNFPHVNATGPYWSIVNTASGNGLVSQESGHDLEQCSPNLCCNMASPGNNEFHYFGWVTCLTLPCKTRSYCSVFAHMYHWINGFTFHLPWFRTNECYLVLEQIATVCNLNACQYYLGDLRGQCIIKAMHYLLHQETDYITW